MLASAAEFLAKHAIVMLMLSVGLRTNRRLLRDMVIRRRFVARALAVIWIAVPLLAILVVYAVRPTPIAAVALGVMAVCPGVPLVVRKVKHAHGDPDSTVLILLTTALTAMVMIPLWAWVLGRFTPLELDMRPRYVADVLVPLILLPFAVGRLTNELAPRVAPVLAKISDILFYAGFALIVVGVLTKHLLAFHDLAPRDFLAAVLIPLGAAVLGYVAGAARPEQRVSIAYAAALGNPMLAITALAHTEQGHHVRAIPIVLAFLVIRALALIPFTFWVKHHHHHDEPAHAHAA